MNTCTKCVPTFITLIGFPPVWILQYRIKHEWALIACVEFLILWYWGQSTTKCFPTFTACMELLSSMDLLYWVRGLFCLKVFPYIVYTRSFSGLLTLWFSVTAELSVGTCMETSKWHIQGLGSWWRFYIVKEFSPHDTLLETKVSIDTLQCATEFESKRSLSPEVLSG